LYAYAYAYPLTESPLLRYRNTMPRDIQESKKYLEGTVNPVLTQALFQMCVAEPEDPFTWLAQVRFFVCVAGYRRRTDAEVVNAVVD